MTDEQINYIGFAVMAVLFWYVQIYRPRKKMRNPGELRLKRIMTSDDHDMYEAIREVFPSPFILKSNISLDDLLYSPELDKKQHFRKIMRQQHIAWLVLDEQLNPVLAVDYSENDDDMKFNYLSQGGIGCCVFKPGSTVAQIKENLHQALIALEGMHTDTSEKNEQIVTA